MSEMNRACFNLGSWVFLVQLGSPVQFFTTPCTAARQAPLSSGISAFAQTRPLSGDAVSARHPLQTPSPFPISFSH